jgi:hypothetical protein
MPHYRVHLNGKNFWIVMDGRLMKLAFLTSRLVDSNDESQAELDAVQLIREHPSLSTVKNDRSDPPMIYCEGIEKVDLFDSASVVQQGLVFYPDEAGS